MFKFSIFGAALALFIAAAPATAAVEVGQAAPDFTATDSNGTSHSLSDFKGKTVVLEWTNHQCPYVVKHYGSGNMQGIQKAATDGGVVWLSIASSAPGKQGYLTGEEANVVLNEQGSNATARLDDSSGEIGKVYGAKTTPHMFVINGEGNIVYAGAIDSNKSFDPATIEGATNYVTAALDSLKAGTDIEISNTSPYGCSVKY